MGALKVWHVIPTGAPLSFFLPLERRKKLTTIDFSSIATNRGICTRKKGRLQYSLFFNNHFNLFSGKRKLVFEKQVQTENK
jgi:hypothetical protein